VDTDAITIERFEGWRKRLSEEQATPMVLVGVGHGDKAGQLVLCVPEGVDDELVVGSLRYALNAVLTAGPLPQRHGEKKHL